MTGLNTTLWTVPHLLMVFVDLLHALIFLGQTLDGLNRGRFESLDLRLEIVIFIVILTSLRYILLVIYNPKSPNFGGFQAGTLLLSIGGVALAVIISTTFQQVVWNAHNRAVASWVINKLLVDLLYIVVGLSILFLDLK